MLVQGCPASQSSLLKKAHPLQDELSILIAKMDGGGFEPPKQFAADLQSVPFGHSGIHPKAKPEISDSLNNNMLYHNTI